MPITKEKPVVPSPFSSTTACNPVTEGVVTVTLPAVAGAITTTVPSPAGETSVTPLPEYGTVIATYPLGEWDES